MMIAWEWVYYQQISIIILSILRYCCLFYDDSLRMTTCILPTNYITIIILSILRYFD